MDDALMKITHVFRAEEHLANTLRQLMVYEALGFSPPQYFHLSLILSEDKKKLSKRSGALSCLEYKKEGYLPSALNNFFALLGWSSEDEKEIFNSQELIQVFSEKRLNPAGAVFDRDKLKWINAQHLRTMPHKTLWNLLEPLFLENQFVFPDQWSWKDSALSLLKSSFSTLEEAVPLFRLLSKSFYCIEKQAEEIKNWPSSKAVLNMWMEELNKKSDAYLNIEEFKNIQEKIKTECKVKGKLLFMPLRTAVIGKLHGFELNKIVLLIERKVLLQRVQKALKLFITL